MRTFSMCGVAALSATALLLSAVPQEPARMRTPLKYGDRCQAWIGKSFWVQSQEPIALLDDKGLILLPLRVLRLRLGK